MNDIKVDLELDCKGLSCPLPVLKTKKAVDGLTTGQVLRMVCTDKGSIKDMPSWSERTGNPILKSEDDGEIFTYWIQSK
ncbi:MAG: sulfurtransferase TusA family protein [SAR324 cluster bacterium]|nr:sulfurtransferase TusA family protein [SAR324 cluster bacterium]